MPLRPILRRLRARSPLRGQWIAALAAVLSLVASPGQAQEAESWRVSGFGTLGITSQSGGEGLGFRRSSSQPGASGDFSATQDARLGLQLNWNPGSAFDAALQAVVLERPSGAKWQEAIDLAYVAWAPAPGLRVRLGRTIPDLFLYADGRNVGYALPWVRPPVDFYGFAPLTAVDGFDLDQRWQAGEAGWRLRLSAGRMGFSGNDPAGGRLPARVERLVAVGLAREEGGLVLKATYVRGRFEFDEPALVQPLREALARLAALPLPGMTDAVSPLQQGLWRGGAIRYLGLGVQYETGAWTLLAEVSEIRSANAPMSGRRAYFSPAYRFGEFSIYGVASRTLPKRRALAAPELAAQLAPVLGAAGAMQAEQVLGQAAFVASMARSDQSTLGVGLRWDVLPNAAIKLQLERFRVHPNGGGAWRHADNLGARGLLFSAVLDFVWGP